MKKNLFALLIEIIIPITFLIAQVKYTVTNESIQPALTSDLFQKSKNQKTLAWILLGVGAGTVFTALMVETSKFNNDPFEYIANNNQNSRFIFLAGGIAMVSSIPLFIISGRNWRRANLILTTESLSLSQPLHIIVHIYAVGINIKFSFNEKMNKQSCKN